MGACNLKTGKAMQKVALITGVTGQDGAYLAEFLLKKGYIVHGIKRRASSFNTERIDHLYRDPHLEGVRFFLHHGDLTDSSNLIRVIQQTQPDEIYNLAAQSHVAVSFESPEYTADVDAVGTLRMLEAIRILGLEKKARFYQASSSELYGLVQEIPQKETTPFYPRSPYAVAKLYAYWITVNYREAYGNVMASRGSVIPLFVEQVQASDPVTVTDPEMTRFMMTLDDAVELVLYAFEHGRNGDIFVQKAPAATVRVLAQAILELMNKPGHPIQEIGTRHGEKLYETLLSREEMACVEDLGGYFRVPPDGRDLSYVKFVEQGEPRMTQSSHGEDYNSHNTTRLDVAQMKELLFKLDFMRRIARGEHSIAEE